MTKCSFFFKFTTCVLMTVVSASALAQQPSKPLEGCGQTKDLDLAITACTMAIAAGPKDAQARVNRGFAYFLKEDYDRALVDYNQAVMLDPKSPNAFARRGLVFRFQGNDDRAIADFTEAISLGSSDPNVFVDRGMAHLAKGDNASAIADYTIAIERDAGKTFAGQLALVARGIASLYSDAPDKAQIDLRRAVGLSPKEPFFPLFLHLAERRTGSAGSLAAATGKLDMTKWPAPAIRMFLGEGAPEDVLAIKGGEAAVCEAVYFVAEFMLFENRKDEALRLYKKAVSDCPRHILEGVAAAAALRSLGVAP